MPVAPVTPVNGESLKLGLDLSWVESWKRSPWGAPHKRAHGTHQQNRTYMLVLRRYSNSNWRIFSRNQLNAWICETSSAGGWVGNPRFKLEALLSSNKEWELGKFPMPQGMRKIFIYKCGVFTVGHIFPKALPTWVRQAFWGHFFGGQVLKNDFCPCIYIYIGFVLLPSNIHHQDCIVFWSTGIPTNTPSFATGTGILGGGRLSNPCAFFNT